MEGCISCKDYYVAWWPCVEIKLPECVLKRVNFDGQSLRKKRKTPEETWVYIEVPLTFVCNDWINSWNHAWLYINFNSYQTLTRCSNMINKKPFALNVTLRSLSLKLAPVILPRDKYFKLSQTRNVPSIQPGLALYILHPTFIHGEEVIVTVFFFLFTTLSHVVPYITLVMVFTRQDAHGCLVTH